MYASVCLRVRECATFPRNDVPIIFDWNKVEGY